MVEWEVLRLKAISPSHLLPRSVASSHSSQTVLIEDMAALLELQWHQGVLVHSLAACSAISLFAKLNHRDEEYREWRFHALKR